MQVLLITGGSGHSHRLSSTELLLPSATSWSYSAALPSPRYSPRGATLDNKVVITGTNSDTLIIIRHDLYKHYNSLHNAGGHYYDDSTNTWTTYNDVLEYDEEEQVWNKIGTTSMKRSYHAVSVINFNSIQDYCTVIDY